MFSYVSNLFKVDEGRSQVESLKIGVVVGHALCSPILSSMLPMLMKRCPTIVGNELH